MPADIYLIVSYNISCLLFYITYLLFSTAVPKSLYCFKCDSRYQPFCEDKFNETDSVSLQHLTKCESECLKWVRQVDPKDRKFKLDIKKQRFSLIKF